MLTALWLVPALSPAAEYPPANIAGTNADQNAPLDEVVVEGIRFGYQEASTVLKVPLSIKDTPQTVLAITGDVMDFAAIDSFQDVYKVDATGGTSHRVDNITVNYFRGFRQDDNYNALKVTVFAWRQSTSISHLSSDWSWCG